MIVRTRMLRDLSENTSKTSLHLNKSTVHSTFRKILSRALSRGLGRFPFYRENLGIPRFSTIPSCFVLRLESASQHPTLLELAVRSYLGGQFYTAKMGLQIELGVENVMALKSSSRIEEIHTNPLKLSLL